jgi:hypothetical protein
MSGGSVCNVRFWAAACSTNHCEQTYPQLSMIWSRKPYILYLKMMVDSACGSDSSKAQTDLRANLFFSRPPLMARQARPGGLGAIVIDKP